MREHKDDCMCAECHDVREHRWQDWNVYPECALCEEEMLDTWQEELDDKPTSCSPVVAH